MKTKQLRQPIILALLLTVASSPLFAETFSIGDDKIYYEDSGEGLPIVLVSGGSSMDLRQWSEVAPVLARTHRVISYDPRAIGRSDNPTVRYSDITDLEQLLDHLQLEQVCLIGLSSAGGFVLEFAATKPERVDRVVAIAPFIPGFEFSASMQARIDDFGNAAQAGKKAFLELIFADPYFMPAPKNPSVREKAREIMGFNFDKGADFDPSLYIMIDPPLIEQLHTIEPPVLLLVGDSDHPEVMRRNEFLAETIKHVETGVIEQSGHTVPVENPTALLAAMLPFLGQSEM